MALTSREEFARPESFMGAAHDLIVRAPDDAAAEVAARAVEALDHLARHLAQLVGERGGRALLVRSVELASAKFPWLATARPDIGAEEAGWERLRAAMEGHEPHAIAQAFAAVLCEFVGVFGNLVGARIAARVLHEVWPEVIPEEPA